MEHANWSTIKLLNGYILLADKAAETVPARIHRELTKLRADVEAQVAADRLRYIVGQNPIRNEQGIRGWVVLAARVGNFENRMNNILDNLA